MQPLCYVVESLEIHYGNYLMIYGFDSRSIHVGFWLVLVDPIFVYYIQNFSDYVDAISGSLVFLWQFRVSWFFCLLFLVFFTFVYLFQRRGFFLDRSSCCC